MCSKKGQPVSKRAQLGSKWLKMAPARVTMGQNGPKCGPEGSQSAQRGQNGLKMAKIPQNGLFQAKFASVFTEEGPPHSGKRVELGLEPLSGGC